MSEPCTVFLLQCHRLDKIPSCSKGVQTLTVRLKCQILRTRHIVTQETGLIIGAHLLSLFDAYIIYSCLSAPSFENEMETCNGNLLV